MVATADLITQIMKLSIDFNNSRTMYITAHPTFSRNKDARLTIYGRCISSLDIALLYLMFRTFKLPESSWWSSLPNEFRNNNISPIIQWTPSQLDRANIIKTTDNHWVFSLFILLFSILESCARWMSQTVYPAEFNGGRGNLTKIYERLLSTNYSKYKDLLELFRLCRNTLHNNGVYFPIKAGDNRHVTFKGITFDFIDGKPAHLQDVPKLLLFDIVPELLKMIEDIVNASDVSKHSDIIDPSA